MKIKAIPSEIVITDTKPDGFVDVQIEFDSRAFEGRFTTV